VGVDGGFHLHRRCFWVLYGILYGEIILVVEDAKVYCVAGDWKCYCYCCYACEKEKGDSFFVPCGWAANVY
jgi:hypothetical protein